MAPRARAAATHHGAQAQQLGGAPWPPEPASAGAQGEGSRVCSPAQVQERSRQSQWRRLKGSLLRDSKGQFKIVIKEDGGGFYFDTIAQTDVSDDRQKFRPRDYLVSIGRKAVDEFTLPMVRGVIKEAGSMLEVEVRRYAPNEARAEARREQERRQEREAQQLQRYQVRARVRVRV